MKYFVHVTLLFSLIQCYGQNLINNPGFEIYTDCPSVNTFNNAQGWYSLNPTPDYYACSYGIPTNFVGYQFPHSGNAHIGFAEVESFGSRLVQPLVPNESYQVEAYVSLGNAVMTPCNEIMIYFSADSICEETDLSSLPHTNLISGSGLLSDTSGWIKISGSYTAQGCEQFIALQINPLDRTYYYLDDISLTALSPGGYASFDCKGFLTVSAPNIFTPNNDGINDRFELIGMNQVSLANSDFTPFESVITNRWGHVVARFKNQNVSWDGTSNGKPVEEGVYFYKVQAMRSVCGEIYNFEGCVQVIR